MKIETVLLAIIGIGLLGNFVLDLHQITIIGEQNNVLNSLNEQDRKFSEISSNLVELFEQEHTYFIITDDTTRELEELSVKGVPAYCEKDPRAEFGVCIVGQNIVFREGTQKILVDFQEKVCLGRDINGNCGHWANKCDVTVCD